MSDQKHTEEYRTQVKRRRPCEECGKPADVCVSFLFQGARSNPASSAYGKDDCSWCSDKDLYACEEHIGTVRRNPPNGMEAAGQFRFEHMLVHWTECDPDPLKGLNPEAVPLLLAACKEFVRKCECGEARSRRSYAQMKKALAVADNIALAAAKEGE